MTKVRTVMKPEEIKEMDTGVLKARRHQLKLLLFPNHYSSAGLSNLEEVWQKEYDMITEELSKRD